MYGLLQVFKCESERDIKIWIKYFEIRIASDFGWFEIPLIQLLTCLHRISISISIEPTIPKNARTFQRSIAIHMYEKRERDRASEREIYSIIRHKYMPLDIVALDSMSRILWNAWNCLLFKPLSGVQVNTVNETDLWMPCIVLFIHSFLSVNSDPACVRHTIPRTVIAVQGQGYSRVQACTSLSFSSCVCTAEYHRMYCVSPLDFNSEARKLFDCNISLWYEFLAIFDCTSQLSWCSG